VGSGSEEEPPEREQGGDLVFLPAALDPDCDFHIYHHRSGSANFSGELFFQYYLYLEYEGS